MRTFRTIILTVVVLTAVVTGLAYNEGIIKIQKVEETHNATVIVDGKVASSTDWSTLLGYEVSIDVVDGLYVGR